MGLGGVPAITHFSSVLGMHGTYAATWLANLTSFAMGPLRWGPQESRRVRAPCENHPR
jgi:hypothetical protein